MSIPAGFCYEVLALGSEVGEEKASIMLLHHLCINRNRHDSPNSSFATPT
jgi:hypothetical protein